MKTIHLFLIAAICSIAPAAFAQDTEKYNKLTGEARQFYETGDYEKAGQKFADAFVALGNKGVIQDRYMAASAWAMAGQPDSAFVNLFKIVDSGYYTDKAEVVSDSTFTPLHTDRRWTALMDKFAEVEAKLDKPLIALLDTIFHDDQQHRLQLDSIGKKHGVGSEEWKAIGKVIIKKDSLNLIKVKQILDERGWLGRDIIGPQGNQTLFLVIQHADLETQQQYLPMMQEAVKNGDANGAELALLEDRIAFRTGKRQTYGSQLWQDPETGTYHVLPLEDPDNVDQRRASVGLGKLADYIAYWGLEWDVEAYKKMLPELEEKVKAQLLPKEN